MFGGRFGPFRSANRHCFDEQHPLYRELAAILAIRRQQPALRRGRQYLRDISGDGQNFGPPRTLGGQLRSVVAWSRILADHEFLAAINTDPDNPRTLPFPSPTGEDLPPDQILAMFRGYYESLPADQFPNVHATWTRCSAAGPTSALNSASTSSSAASPPTSNAKVLFGRVRAVTGEQRWDLDQVATCSSRPAGTGWRAWRTPPSY